MDHNKNVKNLLVVEDERIIGDVCCRILEKEGFNVSLATDGDTAMKMLDRSSYDIFLIDIKLPGTDGLGVYNHISKRFPDLSTRVIFMTGDVLTKDIPDFVTKVGCQLLRKPFTVDELKTAIKKV